MDTVVDTNEYSIYNGKIIDIVTELEHENMFRFGLLIEGDNWHCLYGNVNLFDDSFDSKSAIIDLLKLFEEKNILNLKDKYVRIAIKNLNDPVSIIGNIISDKWYNFNDYKITYEDSTVEKDNNSETEEETNLE